MMQRYIHERHGWPTFHWDTEGLSGAVADVHRQERRLRERLETLAIEVSRDVEIDALTREALGTLYEEHLIAGASQMGGIRFCPHVYNTLADIEKVVDAVASLA